MCQLAVNFEIFSINAVRVHLFLKVTRVRSQPSKLHMFSSFRGSELLNGGFQNSKLIFMISDFEIIPIMLLKQLSFGVLLVNSYFTFIRQEKLHFSLIYSFYCCLVIDGWAVKVAQQFAIQGLVAYNLITYKK